MWCGVVWCGVVWCGVVWCGVVWCGVVWCGVVWCGVVWCSALQELHCPLPPGTEAVHCRSSTAHCLRAVRQCIAEAALSTAPRQ